MRALLFVLVCLVSSFAFHNNHAVAGNREFAIGFNQAWIFNRYGSQWVDGFDLAEFRRVFRLTRQANGNLVRLWLFEGYYPQSLRWENGRFSGLDPRFVANLRLVLAAAAEAGVKLNLTLLDGNMGGSNPGDQARKNYFWNLLNDRYGVRQDFIVNVFEPLLNMLKSSEHAGVVAQIDLTNEVNALTVWYRPLRFTGGWTEANRFVCEFQRSKQRTWPEVSYTASVGWGNAANDVLAGHPWPDCVDFFQFHLYNNNGGVDRCAELVRYAHSRGKKIILGEFGQSSTAVNDGLQASATQNFLRNAYACGLDGAMAWRLAEPEASAHLSYERFGQLRPAYWVFQREAAAISSGR